MKDRTDPGAGITPQSADPHSQPQAFSDAIELLETANARIAYLEKILQKQSEQKLRALHDQEKSSGDHLRSILEYEYLTIRNREDELEIIEAELGQQNDEALKGVRQDLIHKNEIIASLKLELKNSEAGQLASQTALDSEKAAALRRAYETAQSELEKDKACIFCAFLRHWAHGYVQAIEVAKKEIENLPLTHTAEITELRKGLQASIKESNREDEVGIQGNAGKDSENGRLQKKLETKSNMLEQEESEEDELRNKIKSLEIEIKVLECEMLNHQCKT
ncbi:hypothetical protein R3P38DRAFT_2805940 [Favolaschia claudopus]|uniref:Uncharacterized protein n=1 Tax=Favolaschia claudopus TaxID=2862362 RepID=A0AAV9ZLY8_9AGAR